MSKEYQDIAERLNAGEQAATKHKIEEAKVLRLQLLKMAESVDVVSKRIVLLEPDGDMDPVSLGSYTTLKSRIRMASVNFVKGTLVGLPGIPNEEELLKLQENRRLEASKRVEEEKKQWELAKLKFDSNSAKKQQNNSSPSRRRVKPVKFDAGFVSSLSGCSNYVSSDDPIVQQMCNLREFIGQARSAGRHDDAKLLEENLKDLQEEYQRQKEQLEENYESYKHIFSANRNSSSSSNNKNNHEEEEDDGETVTNPFADATEDELAAIESSLQLKHDQVSSAYKEEESSRNGVMMTQELEEETKNITDGSIDFDDYDKSGKNPFF